MNVEFLGVPRQLAGVSELAVDARTLGQLLELLADRLPALSDVIEGNRLHPSFAANLNGDEFISDPGTPLSVDDCVLILSADAGG
jgi:molybdopterin converting factor small subunit